MTDEVVPRLGASRQREAEGRRFVYSDFPLAACPFKRNVLGSSPSPQILNDPKSLYQGPSGASGSVSRHSFSFFWRYLTIRDPIEEMLAENRWKIGPPNFRHQAPNVIRASSSFSCCR